MSRPSGQTLFLGFVAVVSAVWLGYLFMGDNDVSGEAPRPNNTRPGAPRPLAQIPFDGTQAYEYLKQLCDFGPRPSGSDAIQKQRSFLVDHFQKQGATVALQEFQARDPRNGAPVTLANIIIQWHPERKERVLLCAHYDTRPFPDRDRRRPRGRFVGANDGASGIAIMMELGQHMAALADRRCGVDFVLFDAEELVYDDNDPYFLGSEHFAHEYVTTPPAHRYRWGVLLDMVGGKDMKLPKEKQSVSWSDTRPLVNEIWTLARRLGVREFLDRESRVPVNDDHLALRNIARIPTCDVIDFDYPQWHTEQDTPEHCSAISLARVGWVMHEWLKLETER